MTKPNPGTYQWDRAATYLKQCEDPFRRDVEAAMLWRILPPLASKALGLRSHAPLLIPWIGLALLAWYAALTLGRVCNQAGFVCGGKLLVTTSSGGLVPFHWLGLNDAWVWLALLAVSFGKARWALPLASLLAPWVDERFIIGLPLALVVRTHDCSETLRWKSAAVPLLWLAPYVAIRLGLSFNPTVSRATTGFLTSHVRQVAVILPLAPIGWWMGLRIGWLPAAYALRHQRWPLRTVVFATAAASLTLAADISRSIAILLPLVVLGIREYSREHPEEAPRKMPLLGTVALVIPAAHVVYTKIYPISPLPIELFRLFR